MHRMRSRRWITAGLAAVSAAAAAAGVTLASTPQGLMQQGVKDDKGKVATGSGSSSSQQRSLEEADAQLRAKLGARARAQHVIETIGGTPLLEIPSLSRATGCRILLKAEQMNPGGSVKDRPALEMVRDAEARGLLKQGVKLVEATGGNTGIGLAIVCNSLGYKTVFSMPSRISEDKISFMRVLGAETLVQPMVPFSDKQHFYHVAQALGKEPQHYCPDQFENLANFNAHYKTTGPEIWVQADGKVDAFVAAAGTGGTIGGCSTYLKERNPALKVFLIDPPGSGLRSYVEKKTFEACGSSITEGIGTLRLTQNFAQAKIDGAFQGVDQEAIDMAYFLMLNEGIFMGPSAALNVTGAVKAARRLGPDHTIVTIICDTGDRYRSTIFNEQWMKEKNLTVSPAAFDRNSDISFVK